MKTYRFLAFDCGTTSGRAILGTFADDTFRMEEVYRFPNQTLEIGGKYYWNVYGIYEHLLKCLKELGERNIPLDSIGINAWGFDFGCIGHDGTLLGLPRAYCDPYTEGVPEKFFQKVSREQLYALTGIQTTNHNSIFQMYAQAEEGSVAYHHAKRILFMPDLLAYLLTRGKVCETTIATTSGLMSPKTQQFVPSLVEAVGLTEDQIPDRVQPGETVGKLRFNIAKETGLGEVPVVAVAGHDTASAVVAVPAENEHFAYLISGTQSLMGIEVNEPIVTEQSAQLNFSNESGIEGTTCFQKSIEKMEDVEQYKEVLDRLQEFSPFKIEKLYVIGDGSTNVQLNQRIAEAIGMPVVAGPTEATVIGNLMVQVKAAGLVKDRWEMRKMIAKETVGLFVWKP
jgi:rhamnulokinase